MKAEKELIELFQKIGMEAHVAKCFVAIAETGNGKTSQKELQKITGLRQPEISIALEKLCSLGWIDKRAIKEGMKGKKGRPFFSYELKKSVREILDSIRDKADREHREKIESLDLIESFFQSDRD
jgi:Predicted transcriptional regulator